MIAEFLRDSIQIGFDANRSSCAGAESGHRAGRDHERECAAFLQLAGRAATPGCKLAVLQFALFGSPPKFCTTSKLCLGPTTYTEAESNRLGLRIYQWGVRELEKSDGILNRI